MQQIKSEDVLQKYLFTKLETSDNPLPWLKILKEQGFFNPEYNPKPIKVEEGRFQIPLWNSLLSLDKIFERDDINSNAEYINIIIEVIDGIINYKDESGKRVDNNKTDWLLLKLIYNLPINNIKNEYVEYVNISLNSRWGGTLISGELEKNILPNLIEKKGKEILLLLLPILLDYKEKSFETFQDYESILGDYWFSELIKKYKYKIYDICGIETITIIESKIKYLINKDSNEYSIAQIITIEESSQNLSSSYETIMIEFIRDLMMYDEKARVFVKKYIEDDAILFKRLAVYICNMFYKDLKDIFWNYDIFDINELKHELWMLYNNNSKYFNDDNINMLINKIENYEYYMPPEIKNEQEKEKILAIKKKEWLLSLMPSKNKKIKDLYDHYNEIIPEDVEHPGYIIWSSGVTITLPYGSPDEDLIKKSNSEIVAFIKSLKEPDKFWFIKGETPPFNFRMTVKEYPTKFTSDMYIFQELPPQYFNELIMGLYESWKAGSEYDWAELIDFLLFIVSKKDFWEMEGENAYFKDQIVKNVAELIEEGCKKEDHAFNSSLMVDSGRILLLLDEICSSKIEYSDRIMDYVINSPKGAIYSAMMIYSIRYSRLKNEQLWIDTIKSHFNKLLTISNKQSYELYFILGRNLNNIYYLDEDWIKTNISLIFNKSDDLAWLTSFKGYLSGAHYRKYLYILMKNNNNYKNALEIDLKEEMFERILIEHIGIAYLYDEEQLGKDSLIDKIIKDKKHSQILLLINFYWRIRTNLNSENKIKIFDLWEKLAEILVSSESDEGKELLSSLINWIEFVEVIDERMLKLLNISVKHVKADLNAITLINNLLRLIDSYPKEVGKIYVLAAESDEMPFIREAQIIELVTKLYNYGEVELANKICNIFTAKGFIFLKDIYEQYKHE